MAVLPTRFAGESSFPNKEAQRKFVDHLVAQGLRAQLKTSNMLTGALFVDLDFHPDQPVQKVEWVGKNPVFPNQRDWLSFRSITAES